MPIACVAVEHAEQVAKVGPLIPYSMPTYADADEPMMAFVIPLDVAPDQQRADLGSPTAG